MSSDRPPFQEIAKDQLPWLFSLARRLAGEGAEDVVQECLTKAYRSYDDLRDPVAAPAWFRRILVNCARDRFRRESAGLEETPVDDVGEYSLYRTIAEEDPWPYSDSVHLDFLRSFTQEDVWAVLDRLKPMYRVPLVLVHMEGLPTRQVSRMLGVPLNTVLSWLHRGRKSFEREMWEYATENDLLREKETT
ncbi:MAG: RNA polymerase sigma factor [Actinomycetota bacterium]